MPTKNAITKKLTILLAVIVFLISLAIIGGKAIMTKNWNNTEISLIACSKTNLLKLKDVEGNIFVFEDININANFKTNEITFKEVSLGVKSLVLIQKLESKITYLSKNQEIIYDEIINLQKCFSKSDITISNNYNFQKPLENKFCKFVLNIDKTYQTSDCK